MGVGKEQLILFSAEQDNILPLTSACNVKCIFCSHRQNPSGVQVYGIGHRSLEDVEMTLEFIDPRRKIVIGESVTRIMEGEPFLHPEIQTILRMIRERFPETPIQITTNGTLLTGEVLDLLQELGSVELYISINSATRRGRERLMGDDGTAVRQAVAGLHTRGIRFQGSIVAMPWLVGWEDLEETVEFLDEHRALTVRIFMPGFTAQAPAELRFPPDLPQELAAWVKKMQQRYETPLTLEPAFLCDLKARVEGVTRGTAAEKAGFEQGDEILAIDGEAPFSRVDAFYRLARSGRSVVRVNRQGLEQNRVLQKQPGERSGLVFAYDLHPDLLVRVLGLIRGMGARRLLFFSSVLAAPLIRNLGERVEEAGEGYRVETMAVPNQFFGGSIMAGGLLVIQDFLDCWTGLPAHDYDLVLVPGIFLDPWGVDLTGRNFRELEEKMNVPVELVEI